MKKKPALRTLNTAAIKSCGFCVQICIRKKSNGFKRERTIIASTYPNKTDQITFAFRFLFILVSFLKRRKILLFWSNPIAVINQPRLHGWPFFLLITENQH